MAQWYATEYVVIGPPQRTEKYSVGSLELLGVVGVYAIRRDEDERTRTHNAAAARP